MHRTLCLAISFQCGYGQLKYIPDNLQIILKELQTFMREEKIKGTCRDSSTSHNCRRSESTNTNSSKVYTYMSSEPVTL